MRALQPEGSEHSGYQGLRAAMGESCQADRDLSSSCMVSSPSLSMNKSLRRAKKLEWVSCVKETLSSILVETSPL